MTRNRFPVWIILGVVVVVALVVGSGVLSSSPPTAAQRAASIEAGLRCPSCEDLSVANSSAQTAVTVRAEIRQLIAEGQSDQQIRQALVARYGVSIELSPPVSGWSALIWVLPVLAVAVAAVAMGVVFVRRSRDPAVVGAGVGDAAGAVDTDDGDGEPVGGDVGRPPDVGDRGGLEDRRSFLERSLRDAEAEHDAGDLSDEDYGVLVARDTARLQAVVERLDRAGDGVGDGVGAVARRGSADRVGPVGDTAATPATPATPAGSRGRRSRRQRILLGGAVTCIALAVVLVVALSAGARLPGQTSSGNPSLTAQQKVNQSLDQAATLVDEGQLGGAAQLYQQVLDQDPSNEVALAQYGWLEYQVGVQGQESSLIDSGRSMLVKAEQLNPGDFAVHLYLGTVLLQHDGNPGAAADEFDKFLAAGPPSSVVTQAAPVVRQAYLQAGRPVPAAVAAG